MAPYLDDMSSPAPNPGAQRSTGPAAGRDDLDDLFDYDAGLDEVFADLEPKNIAIPTDPLRIAPADTGLGIDKEVEVAKKPRVPRVKLDETRLLSQAGIPRLRKRARELKFKGKGHEYSDAARLLSLYQLWLDDLFPKAQFLDALAMVERLGHKKRIQIMRMDWINEGKPRESVHEISIFDDPVLPPRENLNTGATKLAPIFERNLNERENTPGLFVDAEDDIYNATPQIARTKPMSLSESNQGSSSLFGPKRTNVPDSPEDDLDALLAEQEMEAVNGKTGTGTKSQDHDITIQEQNYDDDMDAMAEMGFEW